MRQPGNKPVLEPRRQWFQRGAAEFLGCRGGGMLAQYDAQAVAGDQRVEHGRMLRGVPRDGTAPAGGHDQAEHPAAQRREELVRRRVGQQLALVQQQHAAAPRGLVQIGGGPHHGHAVRTAFLQHGRDDRPEFAARHRIDADRRLVQQQQPRTREQRAGQAELLLHPAGELAGQARGEGRQAGEAQQSFDACRAQVARHGMQVGEQVEVFRDAEVFVQAECLRHVADRGMHRGGIGRHVVAEHAHVSGSGAQQAGDETQERGLAGAVGADQAGDDARFDGRVDAVQRDRIGIGVAQPGDGGDGVHNLSRCAGEVGAPWRAG